MKLFDPVSIRAVPPNAITAGALCAGLLSITRAAGGHLDEAAWLVTIAALLDKLDGTVARRLGVAGGFGIQFDSFSDLVAFGLAPASLVWYGSTALPGGLPVALTAGICVAYVLMTAIRLARFNVTSSEHPFFFLGLPSTLAGSLVAVSWLALSELHVLTPGVRAPYPWLLLLCAGLMVCNLQLPKLRRSRSRPFFIFQVVNAAAIYVLIPLRVGFPYILAVLLGYIVVGFGRYGLGDTAPAGTRP